MDAASDWNHADYMKEQQNKANQMNVILQILNAYLTENANEVVTGDLFNLLEASCLSPILESYLRNDSLFGIQKNKKKTQEKRKK